MHCTTHSSFSLFSALLGYVQSIPQAALDFRPRVIFFFYLLTTSIPTYLSIFLLFLHFSFFLGEFVIQACAFLCTSMYHPQSTWEHPQSTLDFNPLSHLSHSLTYLPIFLLLLHLPLWENLCYKLVHSGWWVGAQACSISIIFNKICLWIFLSF